MLEAGSSLRGVRGLRFHALCRVSFRKLRFDVGIIAAEFPFLGKGRDRIVILMQLREGEAHVVVGFFKFRIELYSLAIFLDRQLVIVFRGGNVSETEVRSGILAVEREHLVECVARFTKTVMIRVESTELVIGFVIFRIERDHLLQLGFGLIGLRVLRIRVSQIKMRRNVCGLLADCRLKFSDRLGHFVLL